MAQWSQMYELSKKDGSISERVTRILNRCHLPTAVRVYFAEWIETQPWGEMQTESVTFPSDADALFTTLITMVTQKEGVMEDMVQRSSLAQDRQKLLDEFQGNHDHFVQCMDNCLSSERLLIDSIMDNQDPERARKRGLRSNTATENHYILDNLDKITERMKSMEMKVKALDQNQDRFHINLQDLNDRLQKLRQPGASSGAQDMNKVQATLQEQINKAVAQNYGERGNICNDHISLATELALLLKDIWGEIDKFKREQKLYITSLDKPKDGALDILDKYCERGSHLLLSMIQLLSSTLTIYNKLPYNDDKNKINLNKAMEELEREYLKEHLRRCFLVARNVPNQIQKVSSGKSSTFPMAVRLLGGNGLSLSVAPKVTAKLYYERELKDAMVPITQGPEPKTSGTVINGNDKTLELGAKGRCIANFTSIRLEKVQRPDRGKNDELVTEQKYGIVFTTEIRVRDQPHPLKALSLPIVLVSQTSQECMAKGTLIWDAAFSDMDRVPYEYHPKAPWQDVKRVLSSLFEDQTGRGLNEDHLLYLARTIFRDKKRQQTNFDGMEVTEKQLIKDKMVSARPESFSFWKWFWANLNLCRDRVKTEWQDEIIHGFISKDDARCRLETQPLGTFLLRFSETSIEASQKADFCGHLTVAVVEIDPPTGQKSVFFFKEHLEPKDLVDRDLAQILEAFEVADYATPGSYKPLLCGLWPESHKTFDEKFGKYLKGKATKQKTEVDTEGPYKKTKFKIQIYLNEPTSDVGMPCGRVRQDSQMSQSVTSPTHYSQMGSPGVSSPGSPQTGMEYTDPTSPVSQGQAPLQVPAYRPTGVVPPLQAGENQQLMFMEGFGNIGSVLPMATNSILAPIYNASDNPNVMVEQVLPSSGEAQGGELNIAELLSQTLNMEQEAYDAAVNIGNDVIEDEDGDMMLAPNLGAHG